MKHPPMRTCIGCQQIDEQRRLVRVVVDPQGEIAVSGRQMPGRGGYLHLRRECVTSAVKRGGMARSFRRAIRPMDVEELWHQMEKVTG